MDISFYSKDADLLCRFMIDLQVHGFSIEGEWNYFFNPYSFYSARYIVLNPDCSLEFHNHKGVGIPKATTLTEENYLTCLESALKNFGLI